MAKMNKEFFFSKTSNLLEHKHAWMISWEIQTQTHLVMMMLAKKC